MQQLGLDQLPLDKRIELVNEMIENINQEVVGSPLDEATRKEIHRRLAAYEAAPSIVVPWEEVEAAILARLKK